MQALASYGAPPQLTRRRKTEKNRATTPCAARGPRPAETPNAALLQTALSHGIRAGSALALVAQILLSGSHAAYAKQVAVEDVDSPAMQAGLEAANERRFSDAERFFRMVLKQEGDSASTWSNLGNVALSTGRPTEALRDFDKAIALAPRAPVPYLNRALAHEQLGVDAEQAGRPEEAQQEFQTARRDCDSATALDNNEFAAYFNRGNVDMRLKDYKEALESFRLAADLAPGISGYRLREATLMYQLGETKDASRLLRGVVRKYPGYAEARAALAAVEWGSGRQAQAEEQLEAATGIASGWGKIDWVKNYTRWPPRLYVAMENMLSFAPGSAS